MNNKNYSDTMIIHSIQNNTTVFFAFTKYYSQCDGVDVHSMYMFDLHEIRTMLI